VTPGVAIPGGGNVVFNDVGGPSAGVAQAVGGLTVTAAGVYQYFFQVRGTPESLTPPSPLIFALLVNATDEPLTQFASDSQTTSLAASPDGTEAVTGSGLITLPGGAVVALKNLTKSSTDTVTLTSVPLGGTASVNAQLSLIRVA
jgi:hypothetical protein